MQLTYQRVVSRLLLPSSSPWADMEADKEVHPLTDAGLGAESAMRVVHMQQPPHQAWTFRRSHSLEVALLLSRSV